MTYRNVIVVMDECLVTTISGNKFPCGIWDWRAVWPIWNCLKFAKLGQITIVSNNDCIKKGITREDSYWSKMCYISHCISDYTCNPHVTYSYSRKADWQDINNDIIAYDSCKDRTLFIGATEDDYNFAKNVLVCDYVEVNQLIKEINEHRVFGRIFEKK